MTKKSELLDWALKEGFTPISKINIVFFHKSPFVYDTIIGVSARKRQ